MSRLVGLHPELVQKINAMDAALELQGIIIRITQGLRTYAQQDALYAQGRSLPGHIVTNARGGFSAHNFGYAADLCPGIRGSEVWTPNWDAQSPDYQSMATAGLALGLVWGGNWESLKDYPHFQLAGCPVTPTMEMRAAYTAGGINAVWKLLGIGVPV